MVGWEREGWLSNSYAMGSVTRLSGTNQSIGGFVGWNSHSQILNSYSTGKVIYNGSINPDNKGFAGIVYTGNGSWMRGNFWDNQTSMQKTTSGIATGKNTSAMKTRETFKQAGWDLKRVWCMNDHVTYPLLRWNEKFPTSNAGPDQTVDEGTVVMFDGSASIDDRGITNYTWMITDEKTVTLYGATNSYKFNRPGIFLVSLYVKNELGNMDEDTVKVIVSDITPPIADAGPDQIVEKGTYVQFNGSQSTDNVGVVHYEWTFFIGEPIKINGILPTHLFNSYGVFEVTLNVTDAAGFWDRDNMKVIVSDLTPPKAVAGNDLNVNEGAAVTFDGSQSTDNVGIVNWTWTIYDIDPVILYGVRVTYRFNNPGQFVIHLNVSDQKGNWNTDSLTVTVNDISPPVASAGQDRIVDEGTIVIFDGSGSYDNVQIINYTWKFNDGDIITLYGARPVYRFDHPGSFTVTLMVIDPSGHWHSDIVIITVRDTTLPMAVAGSDIYIDQGMTAYFNGSGSSDNVGIAYYNWTFDHGSERVALSGISPIFKFDIPGTYNVILNVTDTSGLWHEDTITVYVTDTIPPVANAGEDRTLPAGIVVIFNGSLSSDNHVIKSHIWTFSYDGEEKTFEGETFEFTFDSGGVYRILLTVIDQFDNRDNDTVSITVIDTGIVKGIVLDEKGDPVKGAQVKITASNDEEYSIETGTNGSFSLEIFHGPFSWTVTKDGYEHIYGDGEIAPMEEMFLDLSGDPMVRERGSGSLILIIIIISIMVLAAAGIAMFLLRKRREDPDSIETSKEE
ncbi:MAG: PKD domain-containing protein [Candidatus Thermoplasmatota archaeon]|nr:PKD domain-containing protein [Candidatus Thermoplasmatota archaeon]